MTAGRKSWDDYFLDIARMVASRGTCLRKQVGCVIVSEHRQILVTGYNGSLPGASHCLDVGCLLEDAKCVRTVHSEANAMAQAAHNGIRLAGSSLYVTASPCWPCFKLLVIGGVRRVVFGEWFYRDGERIQEAAKESGIELVDRTQKPEVSE